MGPWSLKILIKVSAEQSTFLQFKLELPTKELDNWLVDQEIL